MKKAFLFLLLSSVFAAARAQTSGTDDTPAQPPAAENIAKAQDTVAVADAEKYRRMDYIRDMDDVRALRREYWHERVDMHDIRLGIGSVNFSTALLLSGEWFNLYSYDGDYYPDNFRDQMLLSHTYLTPERLVGTFSLSYAYHSRRRIEFGVMATFTATTQRCKDLMTGRTLENRNHYSAAVLPMVRLLWLHRKNISLYSSLAIGISIALTTGDDGSHILPWYDVSLIGCTLGRRFFGFAELGSGVGGMFRAGIGYKFNSSTRKGGIE